MLMQTFTYVPLTYLLLSSSLRASSSGSSSSTAAAAAGAAGAAAAAANDVCQQMLPHEEFPLLLRLIHLNTHSAMKEPIF